MKSRRELFKKATLPDPEGERALHQAQSLPSLWAEHQVQYRSRRLETLRGY
jgi:hypothetical protein